MRKLGKLFLAVYMMLVLTACSGKEVLENESDAVEPAVAEEVPESAAQDELTEDQKEEAAEGPEKEPFVSEWETEEGSAVYMTKNISSEGLMSVYQALGVEAKGENVAVKLSTGEPGSNYLDPNLIKELVQSVDGTIVECNTAYGGSRRKKTEMHMQVAKDHGFTAIADVDIMDAEGSISIPIEGGTHITEDFVGANFPNYDYYVVLSHFKGHQMAGFGGSIKNISIGIASSEGKAWIHTAGVSKTSMMNGVQDDFLESMAEAGKAVADSLEGKILYINVMNKLSIDCDCSKHPAEPEVADIGILASLDPVALDQACVDLIYAKSDEGAASLINRIEQQNGLLTLEHAAEISLGSREYKLVNIDD
ncbi:MAG: DUF362 domain-containing protein [Lachnospiraceae bacterium]